jgi:hypothetical protein
MFSGQLSSSWRTMTECHTLGAVNNHNVLAGSTLAFLAGKNLLCLEEMQIFETAIHVLLSLTLVFTSKKLF